MDVFLPNALPTFMGVLEEHNVCSFNKIRHAFSLSLLQRKKYDFVYNLMSENSTQASKRV